MSGVPKRIENNPYSLIGFSMYIPLNEKISSIVYTYIFVAYHE